MRQPREGQNIEHLLPDGTLIHGVVEYVLSAQFTYRDSEDRVQFCMFKERWKDASERTK